ncbi:cation-translocating P-type ATPase [Geomonas sp. Red69]|uniref:Cation-translocating P-type ATPase n=1 Tax=Geomonas diazotrophica TaxID=2843197 RepID=A0ABX8JM51_9BACT|nr:MULTISPECIES: cation-translocating P-type ATPase [Geomonas]MBU5637146.1 cation-translocating P-type ATPase [Geomonas diazotrophica]QWV99445.1 cation-translocating P-type ATPase [Geomonas nitrogeniifigens]QXE88621.1 cation-translocating P-type ATPase [Geomonas nitrogeniifigens]
MIRATQDHAPWHTLDTAELYARLVSSPAGLDSPQAADRLSRYGANELEAVRPISPWSVLFRQFKNVLIVILLLAALLSAFLGHALEAAAISVIVLFAALLGFAQEYRAERSLESLRRMAAPEARIVRDGAEVTVAARELVPGDLLLLRAGDRVAADVRLTQAYGLQLEEATLTGESLPVDKSAALLADAQAPLSERRNMAYAGTVVSYGRGAGVVVATGMETEFGGIARMISGIEGGRTPLQENLDRVGSLLARCALVGVAVIVAGGLLRGEPFVGMLLFGIALGVAAVPEALPAVVTISLALGVQRMVKRHALMRRLAAVETLGSTTVICSDKTGTLTKDEMTVRRCYCAGAWYEVSGAGYAPEGEFSREGRVVAPPPLLLELLRVGLLACDARVIPGESAGSWTAQGDPTEAALVVAAAKAGLEREELAARYPRLDEIPFSSERKCMTTLHREESGLVACAKGAPEVILSACTAQLADSGEPPLDDAARSRIAEAARGMAEGALRVLAVARKQGTDRAGAESGMTFLGLVGMIDPPRPEARDAIGTCREAGIRPVMITGDHPVTAVAVARELGLLEHGRVVTGAELEAMDDATLEREVESIGVYARVSPAHKLRVVAALQKRGEVVAMTGDGVNDAPALKKADIGVAMGITGTAVSKEAAAMILTDDNFASIVAAVEEGRAIFDNIKKYLMYLLSSNIGEIGLMAGAMLMGLPLPLSAVQILYVNLATDGLPALALAVDPAEPDLMRRPPRDASRGIFNRSVVTLILAGGAWSTLVNLALFAWARASGCSDAEAMTMTFVSLVLIQFFKAYNFRSDRDSVFRRPFANRWLNLAVSWEICLLLAVVYLPVLHRPFGTFSLTPLDWGVIILASGSVVPVLELTKWLLRRRDSAFI